jgi:hypothetical protein
MSSSILEKFPKSRPALPPAFQAIYEKVYKTNRDGGSAATSVAQKMERWMHHKVAADVKDGSAKSTLEVGAGTLNHVPFEPNTTSYDIIEPFENLFKNSPYLSKIRNIYSDIGEIPTATQYERIISIATFEHIVTLPDVVAQCGLLLASGGTLRAAIPSEGTLLWTMGWKFTTGVEFRLKHGLDYGILMRHEHVNTAKDIEDVLRYFFTTVNVSAFGVMKALSFYQFLECSSPKKDVCMAYLNRSSVKV